MGLQFNDTTTENGFCQEVDSICKSTVTSYPLKQKARRMNNALDVYFQKGMKACGNWSIGDYNNVTDLSEATTNLVSGQQDYGLDSTMLILDSVWIAGTNGVFVKLEYKVGSVNTVTTGVPSSYYKLENSIVFDVVPNYSSTLGIEIFYRRVLPRFVSTDTTKTSGLPGVHDFYLARLASLPYLIENGKPQKNDVAAQIREDEIMLQDYYAYRGRDERPKRMVANVESNK
jgi:hypothetical protein